MESFRRLQASVVGMPGVAPSYDRSYDQMAEVLAGAMKLGTQVANTQTADVERQIQDQAAVAKLKELASTNEDKLAIARQNLGTETTQTETLANNLQAQQIEKTRIDNERLAEKARHTEQLGLTAFINNHSTEELKYISQANDGMLQPETLAAINEHVAINDANTDILTVQKLVAADPTTPIDQHVQKVINERLGQEQPNPAIAGVYVGAMRKYQYALVSNAVGEDIANKRQQALDGVDREFENSAAMAFKAGHLPQEFDSLVSRYAQGMVRLNPNGKVTAEDATNNAIKKLDQMIAGPLGQSIGIDANVALEQLKRIGTEANLAKYPTLGGTIAALQSQIANNQIKIGEEVKKNLLQGVDAAWTPEQVALFQNEVKNNKALTPLQAMEVQSKVQDQAVKVALMGDVEKALGANPTDPTDNKQVLLGADHNAAIDRKAALLNLRGVDAINWQVANFGRVTPNALGLLKEAGDSVDPMIFAQGLNAALEVYKAKPNYGIALTKDLPSKLSVGLVVSAIGGEDTRVVTNRLSRIDPKLFDKAEALLNSAENGTKVTNTTSVGDGKVFTLRDLGLDQSKYYSTAQNIAGAGGKADYNDADLQRAYREVFKEGMAMYMSNNGAVDVKEAGAWAAKRADKFITDNSLTFEFGGKAYANFAASWNALGINKSMVPNINEYVAMKNKDLYKAAGIDKSELRYDFGNARKVGGNIEVPILYYGSDITGADGSNSKLVFPASWQAQQDDLKTKKATPTLTPPSPSSPVSNPLYTF